MVNCEIENPISDKKQNCLWLFNTISVGLSVLVAILSFVPYNFDFFAELGYDISIIKGSLTFKFGANNKRN